MKTDRRRWLWIAGGVVVIASIGVACDSAVPASSPTTAAPVQQVQEAPSAYEVISVKSADPVNGEPAKNVLVKITPGQWSDELAKDITSDLWIEYGDVVRVEFRCGSEDGAYLGRAFKDGAAGFEGSANRTETCE